MFGPDDAFLTTVIKLLKRLPIYPMFGRGRTRLQPVYVEDVAEAAAMALQPTLARPLTFGCGGPHVYSYEELLRGRRTRSQRSAHAGPHPIRRLARIGFDRRILASSAHYAEPG